MKLMQKEDVVKLSTEILDSKDVYIKIGNFLYNIREYPNERDLLNALLFLATTNETKVKITDYEERYYVFYNDKERFVIEFDNILNDGKIFIVRLCR